MSQAVPSYLEDYAETYAADPHAAALEWFADAQLGLFMHYGVMSLHGHGDWGLYTQAMPLDEYDKLREQFTAERFDADFITDLALDAGARYVNITAKHHDGFCLWDSAAEPEFNSVKAPAGRDLIAELAEQCAAKKLGFFIYYSYGLDWRHPYFFTNDYFDRARPAYDQPDPRHKFSEPADFQKYIKTAHAHIRELLTNYGPVAGMWFDPLMSYLSSPEMFPIRETYALIRELQPQALISFKAGATGDEDFAAPERTGSLGMKKVADRLGPEAAALHQQVVEKNAEKHNEICDTLSWSWAWHTKNEEVHATPDDVLAKLAEAHRRGYNLLINTGPRPSGEIPPEDVQTLRAVGETLRSGDESWKEKRVTFSHDRDALVE